MILTKAIPLAFVFISNDKHVNIAKNIVCKVHHFLFNEVPEQMVLLKNKYILKFQSTIGKNKGQDCITVFHLMKHKSQN